MQYNVQGTFLTHSSIKHVNIHKQPSRNDPYRKSESLHTNHTRHPSSYSRGPPLSHRGNRHAQRIDRLIEAERQGVKEGPKSSMQKTPCYANANKMRLNMIRERDAKQGYRQTTQP